MRMTGANTTKQGNVRKKQHTRQTTTTTTTTLKCPIPGPKQFRINRKSTTINPTTKHNDTNATTNLQTPQEASNSVPWSNWVF